jgi:hypothetical protein
LIMSNQSSQKTILYEQRNVSECIYRVWVKEKNNVNLYCRL